MQTQIVALSLDHSGMDDRSARALAEAGWFRVAAQWYISSIVSRENRSLTKDWTEPLAVLALGRNSRCRVQSLRSY